MFFRTGEPRTRHGEFCGLSKSSKCAHYSKYEGHTGIDEGQLVLLLNLVCFVGLKELVQMSCDPVCALGRLLQ